jgi:hypothetical protein
LERGTKLSDLRLQASRFATSDNPMSDSPAKALFNACSVIEASSPPLRRASHAAVSARTKTVGQSAGCHARPLFSSLPVENQDLQERLTRRRELTVYLPNEASSLSANGR